MKRILLFAVLLMVQFGFGQSSQTFNTSGTFKVPAGVTSITIQVWGGGGSSGHNTSGRARGGGGGGAYTSATINVTPGSDLPVTVGLGGVYNNSDTATDDGGASSVGVIVANGGKRGLVAGDVANGGAGGLASTNPGGVSGFISFNGGKGGDGYVLGNQGGGGGGGESASSLGTGNNGGNGASNGNGGAGGSGNANGGDGGRGSNNNTSNSSDGNVPGGGGGGRSDDNGNNTNGGAGRVIISWTCPVFAATSYGSAQSICYNNDVAGTNIGRVTYSNVPTDRYIALNVVSGIQYRIATTTTDRGFIKRLTLFNGGNTTTALATTNATATNTAATIDWTATFTGVLYVVFNTANCQTSTQTDDITASYIGGGNNVDNQTAAGNNLWIGHVYNFLDTVPIGASGTPGPSDSDAFSSYIGYFNQNNTVSGSTISFNNGYGGDDNCFNVTAGGTTQTVRTETFSVRYRMQTTSAVYPAGCYFVNITGDDGVRLYIDGTLVFNSWIQQGSTNYNNVLVYLNGNSQLLLDFYEKNGGNVSNFSIFPAATTISGLNTVTPVGPITRCTNTATLLTGGIVATQGNNTIAPVQYQWQSSTDNSTWTDISGVTSQDYTVPGTATATQIYYRRNVRGSTVNSSACVYSSNVVFIITGSNVTPTAPISSAGTNVSCSSFTANWSSVATATSYRLDVSTSPTFVSFVSVYNNLDVGLVTSFNVTGLVVGTTYYYRVRSFNGCSNLPSATNSSNQTVTTQNPSASISGTTTVCQNAASPNITFGNTGSSAITVTYRINSGANQTINVGANTTANVAAPTTTSGTFAYNLVSVAYQSAPTCSTTITGAATITVNPPPTVANAGPDQTGAATCGLTSVTLAGNTPSVGTGAWSIISGTGGTITTPSSATSTFTGTAGNTYTLQWTISNSSCTASTDDVVITFNRNPTTANAGTDQTQCVTTTATLAGNTPTVGTGTWTLVSGSGIITTPSSVTSEVTGLAYGANVFRWTISNGSCTASFDEVSITRFQNPTTANAGTDQTGAATCGLTSVTLAGNTPSVGTGAWSIISGTGGTVTTPSSATSTFSGTAGSTYTLRWTIANSPCTSSTDDVVITFNISPSAPSVGTITDVTCSSAGSVVLSGLQNGWVITQLGSALGSYTSSGTSYTVTGLAVGNYTFRVNNGTCTSASTPNVPIIDASSATWNGSGWVGGIAPDATKNIIIASSLGSPFAANLSGCSLTINTGVTATVPSGVTLTITNAVTTNGQLIFQNNASLVQTTNATNVGAIEYRRISTQMKNFDFTYWSSPVWGDGTVVPKQTAKNLSPNTLADKYFRFDGLANDWIFDDGVMAPGVGFIIRTPKPGTYGAPYPETVVMPYAQPVAFRGIPNNGDYSFVVGMDQYNLVGNPYPSAIRADDFINANNGVIYGALYFWTHNTAITQSGSDYVYTADDYATYNITGGTGTGTGGNFAPEVWLDANNNLVVESGEYVDLNGNGFLDKGLEWIDSNNNNIRDVGEWTDLNNNGKVDLQPVEVISNRPLGNIAAGQSFFVGNADPGSFQFTNAMRVSGNNSQFFKQASTKKTTAIEKNRVWLNLTNSGGAFKQLLVGYITGATNDWDNLYDGPSFDGQEFVDFYSVNKGQNLTIQGRALPFENTDVVPLGYRSTIAGSFDISIDNRDGALANQEIWLEDKKTNTLHELSKGKYTFTAINGVENDRFVLKYTNKTLGTDDNEVADKSLIVSVKNKKITLTSSAETITQVQVFDLLGRKVYDKSKINAQEWSITTLSSSEQTLIVKTTLANGAISSKKIIF